MTAEEILAYIEGYIDAILEEYKGAEGFEVTEHFLTEILVKMEEKRNG